MDSILKRISSKMRRNRPQDDLKMLQPLGKYDLLLNSAGMRQLRLGESKVKTPEHPK